MLWALLQSSLRGRELAKSSLVFFKVPPMLRPLPLRVRQEHAALPAPALLATPVTALCPLPGGEGRAQPPSGLGPRPTFRLQRFIAKDTMETLNKRGEEARRGEPRCRPVSCALLCPPSVSSQSRVSSSTRAHGKDGRLVIIGCTRASDLDPSFYTEPSASGAHDKPLGEAGWGVCREWDLRSWPPSLPLTSCPGL